MDKCKYSVIVPVFNSASLLPRCVESVLAQELCDFELLLIDDGSTDESGSICDNYAKKDSRIIVIHQENAGVSNARNAGLEIAKGMYITFLDSDDWIGPKYLLDFDNDESDYICHSFTTYSEDDTIIQTLAIKEEHASTSKENILRFMEDGYMGYPFAKRFKSTIIRQNGLRFMSNISHTEDTIFILDYLKCAKNMHFVPRNNYHYYRFTTRETLSNRITLEKFSMICVANAIVCKFFYDRGTEPYEALFFSRIGYSYMSFYGRMLIGQPHSKIIRFFRLKQLLSLDNSKKVVQFCPNALWKLQLNERIIRNCCCGNHFRLFLACLIAPK